MSAEEKLARLWARIPHTLFGGRMRTTTVVMCLLWLGLAMLNGQLNEVPKNDSDQHAPASVQRDDSQYQPPVVDPSTETSTSTTPSETSTSSTPPSSSETSRPSGQSTTTVPGAGRETTTERTTDRQPTTTTDQVQQSQQPTETTSGTESTTNPSPGG